SISVAAGDVDGDGKADVIVAAGAGTVAAFSSPANTLIRSFVAFPGFAGDARVAAEDVNGDGKADFIVGRGRGAGPHVKVLDAVTLAVLDGFFAFGLFSGGTFVGGPGL